MHKRSIVFLMNTDAGQAPSTDPAAEAASPIDASSLSSTPRVIETPSVAETVGLSDAPVVVSLGRQSARRVRNLEKGRGRLLRELMGSLDQLKAHGKISKTAQPIVVVVREPKKFSIFE